MNKRTLASISLIAIAAFTAVLAADSKDQMVSKITAGQQPTSAPPYALASHALVGKDNTIAVNAWSGSLVFEGATYDQFKTTFVITDPTAARTITFPNSSGTVALNPAAGSLEFEGATADAFETTLFATDPTADRSIYMPDATGNVDLIKVTAKTATATLTENECYGVVTNTGAAGAIVLTLPTPAVGMHLRVYLTVAQDVDINAAASTQILVLTNATGDAISSAATIGNSIELVAISSTQWVAFASSGTWTDVD